MPENNLESTQYPVLFYICIALIILELASIVLFGLGFPGDGLQAIALAVFLFTYGIGFGFVVLMAAVALYRRSLSVLHKIVAVVTVLFGLNALLVYPIIVEVNYVAAAFKTVSGFARATNEYAWLDLNSEKKAIRKQYKELQKEFAEPSYVFFPTHNGFQLVGKYIANTVRVTVFYDIPDEQTVKFSSPADEQMWLKLQNELVGKPVIVTLPNFETYYQIVATRNATGPIVEPVPVQIYLHGKNILDGIHYTQ